MGEGTWGVGMGAPKRQIFAPPNEWEFGGVGGGSIVWGVRFWGGGGIGGGSFGGGKPKVEIFAPKCEWGGVGGVR